jgi:serine/threonine protein kinase
MPYIAGESLRARLAREGQLSLKEALRVTRDVAEALEYARVQGVIHRDIKPDNILLSSGQALVADFGIAAAAQERDEDARLTETGVVVGTPHGRVLPRLRALRDARGRATVHRPDRGGDRR